LPGCEVSFAIAATFDIDTPLFGLTHLVEPDHPRRHALRQPGGTSAGGGTLARRLASRAGSVAGVEVLSSRVLLHPVDFERSRRFYADTLGLPIFREFGEGVITGVVFFLGIGFLELSGHADAPAGPNVALWLQVRDVRATHETLCAAGAPIVTPPARQPWGLVEMWIEDPDGVRIAVIEVPEDHPLRRRL
jgi:predicted enzyme related to lactoylglutathione lyase